MRAIVSRLFVEHPSSVDETYFQHMAFAFGFSFRLFRAAFAAAAHGVIPGVCEKTASVEIKEMYNRIHKRG